MGVRHIFLRAPLKERGGARENGGSYEHITQNGKPGHARGWGASKIGALQTTIALNSALRRRQRSAHSSFKQYQALKGRLEAHFAWERRFAHTKSRESWNGFLPSMPKGYRLTGPKSGSPACGKLFLKKCRSSFLRTALKTRRRRGRLRCPMMRCGNLILCHLQNYWVRQNLQAAAREQNLSKKCVHS